MLKLSQLRPVVGMFLFITPRTPRVARTTLARPSGPTSHKDLRDSDKRINAVYASLMSACPSAAPKLVS